MVYLSLTFFGSAVNGSPMPVTISKEDTQRIGQQIWQNEGAGKTENLLVWNAGEDFPSLGIGHFIWFPQGVQAPFKESFPQLIPLLSKHPLCPDWLKTQRTAPWQSREQFLAERNSARTLQLQKLLQHTFTEQMQFILQRWQQSQPALLAHVTDAKQRLLIQQRIQQLLQQPAGVYALIDYVNFKGEGIAEKERYQGEGWGLLQVLLEMKSDSRDPVAEFSRAADVVLTRRVHNAPRDETRWLPGWRKRLQTYTQFTAQRL